VTKSRLKGSVALPLALALASLTGACDSSNSGPNSPQWRLERGWITNCTGPEFSRFAQNGARGPGPNRPIFRINDQLVLAIPSEHWPYTQSIEREPRECAKLGDLPPVGFVVFYFQGHWSAGYKPSDVPLIDGTRATPDWVWVRVERKEDDSKLSAADRQYAEEHRRNFMEEDRKRGRQVAGLTCSMVCWGDPLPGSEPNPDVVSLKYYQRNSSFVQIYTDYRSHKYGGTRMYWIAVTSDLAHWRAIDDEVWKRVAEWNLLKQGQPDAQ